MKKVGVLVTPLRCRLQSRRGRAWRDGRRRGRQRFRRRTSESAANGSPKQFRRRLAGVRTWAVRGFPNHLIVYEARPDELYVFAIVHGGRRYQQLIREPGR